MATRNRTYYRLLPIVIVLMSVYLSGCVSEEISPEKVVVPETVSFETGIMPIFNANCNVTGCHSQNGIPPNFSPGNTWNSLVLFGYVNVDDPEGSIVITKLTTGSMRNYATDQDKALLLKWIELGALND